MENGEPSKSRLLIGYLSALGSILTGVAGSASAQALQGAVPDVQLSVARSVVLVLLHVTVGKLVEAEFRVKRETIPSLLYLAASFMAIGIGSFGGATYLPLSEVTGIITTIWIITAFLYSRLVFNKEIKKGEIISALVCVVGIILIVQPSWLFKQTTNSANQNLSSSQNVSQKSAMAIGYVLAILGGVGGGPSFDISGIMLHSVKPIVKTTYVGLFCFVGSVAFMFYLEEPVLMINLSQFMLVLVHTVVSALSAFLLIQATEYIAGPTLSMLYSTEMVVMLIAQYTIMHSVMPGNYNWIEVVGCLILTFGASLSATLDILIHNAKADELP